MSSLSRNVSVFLRDRFTCQYCSKSVLKGELSVLDLSVDHFAPQESGGENDPDNLVTSCKTCNHVKGGNVFETFDEAARFVQSQRKLREKRLVTSALVAAGYQEDRYDLLDLLFAVGGQEVLV